MASKITNKLLKDAIADAEAVRETAIANAKLVLEESITPNIKEMIARRLQAETEKASEEPFEDATAEGSSEMPADSLLDGNFNVEITFSAVGDLMCHSTQFNYAKVGPDSFDFSGVYAGVRDYLKNPDFLMGNLETTFAGKKYPYVGYPIFNTPDDFFHDLKKAGFDLLFTANNHSIDKGLFGLQRTISLMKEIKTRSAFSL